MGKIFIICALHQAFDSSNQRVKQVAGNMTGMSEMGHKTLLLKKPEVERPLQRRRQNIRMDFNIGTP